MAQVRVHPSRKQHTPWVQERSKLPENTSSFFFRRKSVHVWWWSVFGTKYTFTPGHNHPIALTASYFYREEKDRWMHRRGRSPTMPHPTLRHLHAHSIMTDRHTVFHQYAQIRLPSYFLFLMLLISMSPASCSGTNA